MVPREELLRSAEPTELPAVQLVELEGDLARRSQGADEMYKGSVMSPQQRTLSEPAVLKKGEDEMTPKAPSHGLASSSLGSESISNTRGSAY